MQRPEKDIAAQTRESGTFSDGRVYTLVRWNGSNDCGVCYFEEDEISRTVSIDTWNHSAESAQLTVEQARSLAAFLMQFCEAK
jgi:hypothetical protein